MARKLKTDATSKLAQVAFEEQNDTSKPTGIVNRKETALFPTSFRLTTDDKSALQEIVKTVNQESRHRVSETRIIQALIYLGTKLPAHKIIKALGEIV